MGNQNEQDQSKDNRTILYFVIYANIIFGNQYLEYVLLLYIFVCLITKKFKADEFLIYALFIPNKYLQFLAVPMYLFFTGNLVSNHLKWRECLFFILQ